MHRIDLEHEGFGQRGQRYRVRHNGQVLIERTLNPEFDACRALLAKGITGRLAVWHKGASFPAMQLDIEKAAKLRVEEGDFRPRFACWAPRPASLPRHGAQDGEE